MAETRRKERRDFRRGCTKDCDRKSISLISDFYDDGSLRRYHNMLATENEYTHIGVPATRNPIFGDNFESLQFSFYHQMFRQCIDSDFKDNGSCKDLFTESAICDACELARLGCLFEIYCGPHEKTHKNTLHRIYHT